jgi:hypothetical protein
MKIGMKVIIEHFDDDRTRYALLNASALFASAEGSSPAGAVRPRSFGV